MSCFMPICSNKESEVETAGVSWTFLCFFTLFFCYTDSLKACEGCAFKRKKRNLRLEFILRFLAGERRIDGRTLLLFLLLHFPSGRSM